MSEVPVNLRNIVAGVFSAVLALDARSGVTGRIVGNSEVMVQPTLKMQDQKSRRSRYARTVPEFNVFKPLKLASSEKQTPQSVENTGRLNQSMEVLEPATGAALLDWSLRLKGQTPNRHQHADAAAGRLRIWLTPTLPRE